MVMAPMNKSAVLSGDGVYRYSLTRSWAVGKHVLFIMFNPSTADGETDDHTIRKCIGFAKEWGFAGIVVVNLFALRSRHPHDIALHSDDPVGEANDAHIRARVKSRTTGIVVCAWGCKAHMKGWKDRPSQVVRMIAKCKRTPLCLGKSKDGTPRHPLMLAYGTPLQNYEI
jgi:hypothetical protein